MLHKTIFYLSVEHDLLFTKIVILTEIPIEFKLPSSVATTVVLSHVQLLIPTCNPWGADKVFFFARKLIHPLPLLSCLCHVSVYQDHL